MQTMSNILSLAIWIPVAFGILLLALGRQENATVAKWVALIGAIIGFAVTIPVMTQFDGGTAAMQFVENASWIERFNVFYHLGVDGISMWFVPLTAFITIIVVLAGWEVIEDRPHQYYGAFLILSGLMIGVFSALDGLLFYVFFEATLIPMYIIIGVWGGPRRVYAAFKFFLYTLLGSLLMLVALVYLYYKSGGSFDILTWHKLPLPATPQALLFGAFFAAFAVKVPMWPVHTWLPDAHVEAPTGGSVVLAAIMLKLGCYGFLRFMSIAHMGFVTLGFFIFNELGIAGGLVQMIAHGFVSGAMFLSIGVLYDRVHSREIASYGGVVNTMPKFAAFALLFSMANCGLPGTAGFVGEWMVILGAVQFDFAIGLLAATALIFGAAYTLWMYKRVYFGDVTNDHVRELQDINAREFLILAVLAAAVLWMGIQPKPFTDAMHVSVVELIKHVSISKLN
jgi:NADH-quinone oxidoreductase subunit M